MILRKKARRGISGVQVMVRVHEEFRGIYLSNRILHKYILQSNTKQNAFLQYNYFSNNWHNFRQVPYSKNLMFAGRGNICDAEPINNKKIK